MENQVTLQKIAIAYRDVQRGNGRASWRWGRSLLKWLAANERKSTPETATCAAIGKVIGLKVRRRPYSKTWASRVVNVLRAWPKCPRSAEDCARFTAAFHGNQTRGSEAGGEAARLTVSGGENSRKDTRAALKALRGATTKCVRAGCSEPQIQEAVASALSSAAQADAA